MTPDATNAATNPNLESGTVTGWASYTPDQWPITVDSLAPISGRYSAMCTRTATAPSNNVATVHIYGMITGGLFPVAGGVPATASLDIRCEMSGRYVQTNVLFYDSSGGASIGETGYKVGVGSTVGGQVYRLSHSFTPPPGAVGALVLVVASTDGLTVATTGERIWYDNFRVGADATYFDGDTPISDTYTYRWVASANTSASERHLRAPVAPSVAPSATCELWLDGQRVADTPAELSAGTATALDGLSLSWGRDGANEQPGPATCQFDLSSTRPAGTFLDACHVGTRVDVWAEGDIPNPASSYSQTMDDGSFGTYPLGPAGNYAVGSGNVDTAIADAGAEHGHVIRVTPMNWAAIQNRWVITIPPRKFSDTGTLPDAWDDIPKMKTTDPAWRFSVQARGPVGSRLTLAALAFKGPYYAGWSSGGQSDWVPATGDWQTLSVDAEPRFIIDAATDAWAGLGVFIDQTSGATWTGQAGDWTTHPEAWVVGVGFAGEADNGFIGYPIGATPTRRVLAFSGQVSDLKATPTPAMITESAVVATNAATNPNLESQSLTGWSSNNTPVYPLTLDVNYSMSGRYSAMTTRAGALTPEASSIYLGANLNGGYGFDVTPGVPITGSVDVKCEKAHRKVMSYFYFYNAAHAGIGLVGQPITVADTGPAGTLCRSVVTQMPLPGAACAVFIVIVSSVDGSASTVGERVWFDQACIGGETAYFDGSTPAHDEYEYRWTGAVNNSTSEKLKVWIVDGVGLNLRATAVDIGADLTNRVIGDTPWPAQSISTRARRIMELVGLAPTKLRIDAPLGDYVVTARDIDAQPAYRLLQDLAQSAGGTLWAATHAVTAEFLWMENPERRQAIRQFVEDDTGSVVIVGAGGLYVSACDILQDGATWSQDSADVITIVAVTWQDQTLNDAGQVEPTERTVTVTDSAAVATYGTRRLSYATELTAQADASALAERLLSQARAVAWRFDGLVMDTGQLFDRIDSVGDHDRATALMDLLDGTTRMGLGVTFTDMPDFSPTGATTSAYVEGGHYIFDAGCWRLELTTTPSAGQGTSATWQDMLSTWLWEEFDATIAWTDAHGTEVGGAAA